MKVLLQITEVNEDDASPSEIKVMDYGKVKQLVKQSYYLCKSTSVLKHGKLKGFNIEDLNIILENKDNIVEALSS